MRNFCILAASLALFGCASVNTEKSQTQTAAKKSDSDAFMILAEGLPDAPAAHDTVTLGDGTIYKVEKTDIGKIFSRTSGDGGKTWTDPTALTYSNTGKFILNPNSRPQIFKLPNGSAILLFYNNTSDSYEGGNVVWASVGRPSGKDFKWSQPEALHVAKKAERKYSLPMFFQKNGSYWLYTRVGKRGALRKIDPVKAEFIDREPEKNILTTRGLILNLKNLDDGGRTVRMPRIPEIKKGGLTVEFIANFESAAAGVTIFDNTDTQGKGLKIETAPGRAFSVILNDGVSQVKWVTDSGAFTLGKEAHIAIVIDGKLKLAMSVYDGQVCDGDFARPYGWETFYPEISSINALGSAVVAKGFGINMKRFRIYSRPLTVFEILSNINSGK